MPVTSASTHSSRAVEASVAANYALQLQLRRQYLHAASEAVCHEHEAGVRRDAQPTRVVELQRFHWHAAVAHDAQRAPARDVQLVDAVRTVEARAAEKQRAAVAAHSDTVARRRDAWRVYDAADDASQTTAEEASHGAAVHWHAASAQRPRHASALATAQHAHTVQRVAQRRRHAHGRWHGDDSSRIAAEDSGQS
jgi:hypothetical protein